MFPWGKYIVPQGRCFSPQGKFIAPQGSIFDQGTFLTPWETYLELVFSLPLLGEVTF